MATSNFKFNLTTQDSDGNTNTESVSVNSGPSEATPPTVIFNFPSGVRAEAGDSIDPYWSAATKLATVFCKVYPTPRPDEGGNGDFLVQCYSTAAKWPNSPDNRFEQTFEGVGGQLAEALTDTTTNYMTVVSGIGVSGSGLCQSSDYIGLRKVIQLTYGTASTSTGTRVTRFGRVTRVGGGRTRIGDNDEGVSAYHHDLTTNRVYTLERGGRAMGRPLLAWTAGTNITIHPYHYVPMYSNTGASDTLVTPHIMVQEVGTQYPLTGRMSVTGTAVVGTNTDFLNEISGGGTGSYLISGGHNVINFGDAEAWYVISGVTSATGLVIYNYGDSLALTNQPAQVNAFTLGSGTVSIKPALAGCDDWTVTLSPQYETGAKIPSLSIDYTASIQATKVGGAISGTPEYEWQVDVSGVNDQPTWSGLVPGNLSTQTVIYEYDVAKRIRVLVSGAGQPACTHVYDTGDLSLIDALGAGTWRSTHNVGIGGGNETTSNIRMEQKSARQTNKYYHHHLAAMKPMQTKTTASISSTASTIYVTAGTIDTWPNKGTVIIKGPVSSTGYQRYPRFRYTGKTNNSLTGVSLDHTFTTNGAKPYDYYSYFTRASYLTPVANSDIWIQQVQPHPYTSIEAIVAGNKVKVRDAGGLGNGSTNRWVRFAPDFADSGYPSRGGKMIDTPYKITDLNRNTNEITLDRNLHSSIKVNNICVCQPYTDQVVGAMYPTTINKNRLNFMNTAAYFVYGPMSTTRTLSSSTGIDLYVWDPMFNIVDSPWTDQTQHGKIPAVGRMVFPLGGSSSTPGIVVEYNGMLGPYKPSIFGGSVNGVTGSRPGVFKLSNVKIVPSLGNGSTSWTIPSRAFLHPFQDVDIIPLSTVSFEPTDASVSYEFNGGTSKHFGWSQPLVDRVFTTASLDSKTTTIDQTRIPAFTNYEQQVYSAWPTAGLRSCPPHFFNSELSDIEGNPGDTGYNSGGGCIHYDSIVEIWNGEGYDKVAIKDVEIGQLVHTPEGPKEVIDKIESRHGHTRIINTRDGNVVHCTHIHPIATVYDNKIVWRKAALVEQGETVMTDTGPQLVDSNICVNFTGRTVHPFYDITVAEVKQFFANGILVHNKESKPPYSY